MPFDNPNTRVEIATNEEELALLRDVRELIALPQNWTKSAFTRTTVKFGLFRKKEHVSYCMIGALAKVCGDRVDAAQNIRRRLEELAGTGVEFFNDRWETKHPHVLSLLDSAIASFE